MRTQTVVWIGMVVLSAALAAPAAADDFGFFPERARCLEGEVARVVYRFPPLEEKALRVGVRTDSEAFRWVREPKDRSLSLSPRGTGVLEIRDLVPGEVLLRLHHPGLEREFIARFWVFPIRPVLPDSLAAEGTPRVGDPLRIRVRPPTERDERGQRWSILVLRPGFVLDGGTVVLPQPMDENIFEAGKPVVEFNPPKLPGPLEVRLVDSCGIVRDRLALEVKAPDSVDIQLQGDAPVVVRQLFDCRVTGAWDRDDLVVDFLRVRKGGSSSADAIGTRHLGSQLVPVSHQLRSERPGTYLLRAFAPWDRAFPLAVSRPFEIRARNRTERGEHFSGTQWLLMPDPGPFRPGEEITASILPFSEGPIGPFQPSIFKSSGLSYVEGMKHFAENPPKVNVRLTWLGSQLGNSEGARTGTEADGRVTLREDVSFGTSFRIPAPQADGHYELSLFLPGEEQHGLDSPYCRREFQVFPAPGAVRVRFDEEEVRIGAPMSVSVTGPWILREPRPWEQFPLRAEFRAVETAFLHPGAQVIPMDWPNGPLNSDGIRMELRAPHIPGRYELHVYGGPPTNVDLLRLAVAPCRITAPPDMGGVRLADPEATRSRGKLDVLVDLSGSLAYSCELELYRRGCFLPSGTWILPRRLSGKMVKGPGPCTLARRLDPGRYEVRLVLGRDPRRRRPLLLARLPFEVATEDGHVPFPDGLGNGVEPTDLPGPADELTRGLVPESFVHRAPPAKVRNLRHVTDLKTEPAPEATPPESWKAPPTLMLSSGHHPLDPRESDTVHLGVRLANPSHREAAGVTLEVRLFDERLGRAPTGWKAVDDEIQPDADGGFRCRVDRLGPGEAVDLFLTGPRPDAGSILWTARWSAEGAVIGRRTTSGRIASGPSTRILDVVCLADQKAVTDGVHACPYPYRPADDNLVSTPAVQGRTRTLFVVGRNLPREAGDLRSLTSGDPCVRYSIPALPTTGNAHWRETYANAWRKYTDGKASSPGDSGLEGLLVRADLLEGILPGRKSLALNGGGGGWDLRFGDVTGRIFFVREWAEGRIEEIETAYPPGTVRIAVTTNIPLPARSLLVDLETSGEAFGDPQVVSLVARRLSLFGDGVFVTPPIVLSERGRRALTPEVVGEPDAVNLHVTGRGLEDAQVFAEINARVADLTFAVRCRVPRARLGLARTPAREVVSYGGKPEKLSFLWKEALLRAARSKGIKVDGWDELDSRESEEIWNLIVFTRKDHYLSRKVRLGHHAAMLLLRDMFAHMMREAIVNLEKTIANDRAVLGFLEYMDDHSLDEDFPVNRLTFPGPGGEPTPFALVTDDNLEDVAKDLSTPEKTYTPDEIASWRLVAGKQALRALIEAATETVEMAEEVEDGEIEELLRVTGYGFEPVCRRLLPRMVKLEEWTAANGARRLHWVPDQAARDWIEAVAPLARAVSEQELKADTDNDLILAAAAVLTMPLMLSESAVIVFIALTVDLLDLAVTSVKEISAYSKSQWEREFSEGATPTLGNERNRRANENAKSWVGTAFAIGSSALGAAGGALDAMRALPKLALQRKVARGRKLTSRVSATDLDALDSPDLQDFVAFAADSKARALAGKADSLSDTQRRAIEIIDRAAARRKTASATDVPDVPPTAAPSGASVTVDPGTGVPSMSTGGRIRLRKPRPSPRSARAPPKPRPDTPPNRLRIDQSNLKIDEAVLRAPAGTEVVDPRPFGMMPDAMRHFQQVVDRLKLRIRVRAANVSSLQWMRKGHPPKHVKLKSKTINNLDVKLGAREGAQGQVGYFMPKRPPEYDEWIRLERAGELKETPRLLGRYRQRLNEYWDNWKDMQRLQDKGLVTVEQGVVMDRGLSSFRLDPKEDILVPFRGPPEGTGKAFTGDYDMWDICHLNGSRVLDNHDHPRFDPDAFQRKKALFEDLGSGPANTQHGPHKDWIPKGDRDTGIDAKIRDSHRGQRMEDGSIGPRPADQTRGESEALLEFRPGKQPRVSYEFDELEIVASPSAATSSRRSMTFADADGQMVDLPISGQVGSRGATSIAYRHADYPDSRVVRVTTEEAGNPAIKLDDFGRRVLEKEIASDHIRAAREFRRWDLSPQEGNLARVAVVEKVVPIRVAMKETAGVMTKAQRTAFEGALRDLNRRGYAWLDNTWDNFGFVNNAKGEPTVVVLDTGGIVKVAGDAKTAAATARSIQVHVNGPMMELWPAATRLPAAGRSARRAALIRKRLQGTLDLKTMDLERTSQVKFSATSGERFEYIGPSFLRDGK